MARDAPSDLVSPAPADAAIYFTSSLLRREDRKAILSKTGPGINARRLPARFPNSSSPFAIQQPGTLPAILRAST
jgi:hypothetical protein